MNQLKDAPPSLVINTEIQTVIVGNFELGNAFTNPKTQADLI